MYRNKKCLIAKGYYWPNTKPMKTKWTTENIPSQAGRRAVITGANSGIGFEAALALAHKGAELILPAKGRRARPTMRPHAFWSRSRTHGFIQRYLTLPCWIPSTPSQAA
jgi:hypothetical protein